MHERIVGIRSIRRCTKHGRTLITVVEVPVFLGSIKGRVRFPEADRQEKRFLFPADFVESIDRDFRDTAIVVRVIGHITTLDAVLP